MLVDNGVHGDSRVQKTAASAAAAGWDVVLLGRGAAETWQLGGAEVRLIPTPSPLAKGSHTTRRRWLRGPLGYPPTGIAAIRAQKVKAWQADLRFRRALGTRSGAAKLRLSVESALAKVTSRWVSFRYWQLNRKPRTFHGPWDRAVTRFWQATLGDRAWRRLAPHLWDFELAFGPVIDELKPDLIHANDFRMLGVGARAKTRAAAAGRQVKLVWDAHEFVPGIRPLPHNARWNPAIQAHEREYASFADAVVTVSGGLAELLRVEHGLASLPTVVLNAPLAAGSEGVGPDLRGLCGVGVGVPLVVYSGAAAVQRGLDLMVEALPRLGGVHVALVVNAPSDGYVRGLVARAEVLGVGGRLHVLPYVAHDRVVGLLSGADVGVIPIHRWPNHEIALITKFFEYAHARLPMVVSDVRTMADAVRAAGIGEVFRSEDLDDFVRAVESVLADPGRYRAAYEDPELLDSWTWERQFAILDESVYARLAPTATTSTPASDTSHTTPTRG
ncbi:glycosyltransferase family 4 protein [Asanoa ferruginea]|nr:glycosyltransferase family 4 protein [Asanoa ferruginea]